MERDFKGVWISKEIWLAKNLNWSEKVLLTEIDSLSKLGECFASNEYFAEFLGLSKDRVSKLISSLSKKKFISVKILYKDGTKQVEKRVISPIGYGCKRLRGIGENNYTPIGENNEDNNTVINNTNYKKETTVSESVCSDKKEKFDPLKAELPKQLANISGFSEAWAEWVKYRKGKKKPISEMAFKKQMESLLTYPDPVASIEKSIENDYQGLFPVKPNKKDEPKQQKIDERSDYHKNFLKNFGY